jgi:hypothetical protein
MSDLDTLSQKILNDPTFLKERAVAPEAALKQANITVSDEVLKALKGKDEAGMREYAAKLAAGKTAR